MGYRWAVFFLAGIIAIEASQTDRKTLRETMPAYAIATNLDILNASSRCRADMTGFRDGVDAGTLWSLRMLDASGEPGSGYTEGNNYWIGKVHQCRFLAANTTLPLSGNVRRNNSRFRDPATEHPPFEISFFVARMLQNSTIQYHVEVVGEDWVYLGLCMPASCTTEELAVLAEKVFRDRTLLVSHLFAADFKLIKISDLKDDHQWLLSGNIILIILILVFMVSLVVVATFYDILVYQKRLRKKKELLAFENNNTAELKIDTDAKREASHEETEFSNITRESKLEQIIICFSAYSNTNRLFNISSPSDSLLAFHGLKLYGMLWIIMGHTIFFTSSFVGNKPIIFMTTNTLLAQIIGNATYSVDTFFCISGFLLAYSYLEAQKREKTNSWSKGVKQFYMMILKRYIRLTPAYMLMIMISILNYTWHQKTSVFQNMEPVNEMCQKYWWRNLLYINNFYTWDELCLSWSWYLTNDMQFFVFGSFLLILSTMYLYTALSIGIVSLVTSMFITGYIGYNVEYYPTLNEQYKNLSTLYIVPWTRVTPFLVGMLTGCLITKWNKKLHLSKKAKALGWTFGIVCNTSILLGPGLGEPSFTASIFYLTLGRTLWGLGIMWLIIACLTDNGGIINKFLSIRAWIPLSRLTYTFYLVNPFIITSIYMTAGYPLYTDILIGGAASLGMLLVSYACAVVLSLVGEIPAILLLRLLSSANTRMK